MSFRVPVDGGHAAPKKSPMRHAADLDFHLAAAARSAAMLERFAPGRQAGKASQVKEIVKRLRKQARELERELVR